MRQQTFKILRKPSKTKLEASKEYKALLELKCDKDIVILRGHKGNADSTIYLAKVTKTKLVPKADKTKIIKRSRGLCTIKNTEKQCNINSNSQAQ